MHSVRNGSLLCMGLVFLASCAPLSPERLQPAPPTQPAAIAGQVRPTLLQPESGASAASGATVVPQSGEQPTAAVPPASAPPPPTNGPTPSSITAPATAAPAGGAAAGSAASPLKRRDPAPAGVVEQLSFGGGAAGGGCGASGHAADISMRELEIGETWSICLTDFTPGRDIDVQVALPNGETRQRRIRTTDLRIGAWEWYAMPGDPLGTYVVMASQGDLQVTRTFELKAPTRPHISMRPSSGPAGTPFQIIITGFQPNTTGLFPVYRYIELSGDRYGNTEKIFYSRYLTSVPIQFNDRGEGTYLLTTRQDDPPGLYMLYVEDNDCLYVRDNVLNCFTLESPIHKAAQTQAPIESTLQRHESPPTDVKLFRSGPSSWCVPRTYPGILLPPEHAGETEIPFENYICLSGFVPNQDVPIEVRKPDRRMDRRQIRVNEDGVGILKWVTQPGDPWGRYTIIATQEIRSPGEITKTETFTGTFTVRLAAQPAIISFTQPGSPGTSFEILFSGYQPNQTIEPRLYRESLDKESLCKTHEEILARFLSNPVRYLTSLPTLPANERGEARLTLQSMPDDPPGTYFLTDSEYNPREQHSPRSFARFSVLSSSTPELRLTPTTVRIGETMQIVAAGFHPYECIDLGLYRRTEDGSYTYIESLTNFRADDQGRAIYAFTIAPDFQSGTYVMIRKGVQAEFTVAPGQPAATNQGTATAQTDASGFSHLAA